MSEIIKVLNRAYSALSNVMQRHPGYEFSELRTLLAGAVGSVSVLEEDNARMKAELEAVGAGGVQRLEAAPQAVQAAVPVDMRLVPVEFVRGFSDLAHNYSLSAVAPDYYHGVERDAFRAAYERCGRDLAKLREILSAAPAHPAEGVPAQAVSAEVDLPDVEDMAHSALQEALSFGLGHDVLNRWMRKVMTQTQAALAAQAKQGEQANG